jgi:hypothetical protein
MLTTRTSRTMTPPKIVREQVRNKFSLAFVDLGERTVKNLLKQSVLRAGGKRQVLVAAMIPNFGVQHLRASLMSSRCPTSGGNVTKKTMLAWSHQT